MNKKEFEAALNVTMDAVLEQYVQPMTNAMCLLTYAVSHTFPPEDVRKRVNNALRLIRGGKG